LAEARASNPLVEQFRTGKIPQELKLTAAQGALPLTPTDLVELLTILVADRNEEVRTTAARTLGGLDEATLLPILKDKATPPDVLGWCVAQRPEPSLREAALQNVSTADEAIEAIVGDLPEALAELVVINQVRLLRRTSLLVALEANPALNRDQTRRLRELRETFHIGEEPAVPAAEPVAPPEEAAAPAEEPVVEEVRLSEEEFVDQHLSEDEKKTERVSVVKKLFNMTTAGKVIAALKGGREERAILIRDPNRIVASAVLGSPRVTGAEVETFAGMKNVSDEILRSIGTNRAWLRSYGIALNLVKNPRTPLAIAMGLVSRLNPRDIKLLAVDRNVSEAVRKQAQRFGKAARG
jgi:hypothetical protein